MRKVSTIILWGLLTLFLVAYLLFRFGMNMSKNAEQIGEAFADAAEKPRFHEYAALGRQMHYAELGADSLPTILFIHGSPGSWDAYLNYFKDPSLIEQFRLISVDRIGYGKSSLGQAESSLQLQAELIAPILAQIPPDVPLIVVGHSFGGPVAVKLAMDHPERVQGLMLLAALADPVLERRLYWLQKPFRSKALRWLLPPDMDVSNREILPLKEELALIQEEWGNIQARTILIQGDKDVLVHPGHADFAYAKLEHAPVELIKLPEENHFIVWTQQALICENLIQMKEQLLLDQANSNFPEQD